jgi:hypothetical protein
LRDPGGGRACFQREKRQADEDEEPAVALKTVVSSLLTGQAASSDIGARSSGF